MKKDAQLEGHSARWDLRTSPGSVYTDGKMLPPPFQMSVTACGWWHKYVGLAHVQIAEQRTDRRPLCITDRVVRFNTKDKKLGPITTEYSLADFVQKLADQVPDDNRHQPRYFGLLAPNTQARTSAAVMLHLGQKKRSIPRGPSWRSLIRRCYGKDPLLDSRNQQMYWVRCEKPRLKTWSLLERKPFTLFNPCCWR